MKKIKGLALRRLGTEFVIVAESLDLIDFNHLVSLNESAAYIWESLPDPQTETNSDAEVNPTQASDSDFDIETITRLLTARYDVEEATARQDAQELLSTWLRAGIIIPG